MVKFDPSGEFILDVRRRSQPRPRGGDVCTAASGDLCKEGGFGFWAQPENSPFTGFSQVGEVAVDGTAGPSAGDVYVVERARGQIFKFDSSGHLVEDWGIGGQLDLAWVAGIAVDAPGHLLALDGGQGSALRVFDADGRRSRLDLDAWWDLGEEAWRSTPRVAITRSAATPR